MPKFSIIVPVFNVENYVEMCVDSILNQSFKDFEIILINDGSTDKSGLICDKLTSKDSRISVIHKENGGLADARNSGIAVSKGDYLFFIDSDDYIEQGTLREFNEAITRTDSPDILITRMKEVYDDFETVYKDENMPIEIFVNGKKEAIIEWLFTKSNNLWPAQRYLVNRQFVIHNKMKFPNGYLHEDLDWTTTLFLHAKTLAFSTFYGYNHRMARKGSITNSNNAKRTIHVIQLVEANVKNLFSAEIDINIKNILIQRLVISLYGSLRHYQFGSSEEKRKIVDLLNKNTNILKYSNILRHKAFLFVSRFLGFRLGLRILNILHK